MTTKIATCATPWQTRSFGPELETRKNSDMRNCNTGKGMTLCRYFPVQRPCVWGPRAMRHLGVMRDAWRVKTWRLVAPRSTLLAPPSTLGQLSAELGIFKKSRATDPCRHPLNFWRISVQFLVRRSSGGEGRAASSRLRSDASDLSPGN